MKKLLFIPMLLIAVLSSYAQDVKKESRRSMNRTSIEATPEQRAELKTQKMAEQLALTKEQQDKIYQLSLKQAKIHSEQAKKAKELAKLMKEENQKSRQEIESLLTPEQQKKWDELKSKQMKSRKGKIDSSKRDFKSKAGMIKKPDSIQSRRPVNKITPGQ